MAVFDTVPYTSWSSWDVTAWRLEPFGKRCKTHKTVPALGYDCGDVSFTGKGCGCEGFVMRPRPPEEIARIERMREDAYEEATIQKAKEIEARRRMAISDV